MKKNNHRPDKYQLILRIVSKVGRVLKNNSKWKQNNCTAFPKFHLITGRLILNLCALVTKLNPQIWIEWLYSLAEKLFLKQWTSSSMKVVTIFQDAPSVLDTKTKVLQGIWTLHDVCTVNNKLDTIAPKWLNVLRGSGIGPVRILNLSIIWGNKPKRKIKSLMNNRKTSSIGLEKLLQVKRYWRNLKDTKLFIMG